jgi:hypothetical protein
LIRRAGGKREGFGKMMKTRGTGSLALALGGAILTAWLVAPATFAAGTISLAGEWRFALDRTGVGTNKQWFAKNLPGGESLGGELRLAGQP